MLPESAAQYLNLSQDQEVELYFDYLGHQISFNYTLTETYSDPDGKFNDDLGNIALIDCHSMKEWGVWNVTEEVPGIGNVTTPTIDFCNVTMTINAVFQDQVKVYAGDKAYINNQVS